MQKRMSMKKKSPDILTNWTVEESVDLYGVERWSGGIFSVNENGNACLRTMSDNPDIDLKALVDDIRMRGLQPPVLLRFTDVLRQRIASISGAFEEAIRSEGYHGQYQPVYPIKVNQHRHVVEDIMALGRDCRMGLECGSKAELVLAMAMQDNPEAVVVCNGFKDRHYIELALTARQLGFRIFLVVEKFFELPILLDLAKKLKVDPLIGIRMKLASRGRGPWEASGGDKSKFGLTAGEILDAVKLLRKRRMLPHLQLLHSHIGSQVTDIHRIRNAFREAANIFVEIRKLGAPLQYIDVGGGLAVDYDGSHTNFESSANYDVSEYASDVVSEIRTACDEAEMPHPTIITETGRALVAHHSVLVVEAMAETKPVLTADMPRTKRKLPEVVLRMQAVQEGFTGKNFQEAYHDAVEARREALMLFNLRHLSLEHRAAVERMFWSICSKIQEYATHLDYIPDDLNGLERLLASTYFCNFSLFQSLPDHWAIKQLFPIMPLHRHCEKPTRRGVLADVTCDSDGAIDRFVDLRDVRDTVPLHALRDGESYDLGVFLVGAYQEILGDLHNLYGDTHVVHVSSSSDGYVIDKTVEGERIEDVLDYVEFSRKDILSRFRSRVETAIKSGVLTLDQSAPLVRKVDAALEQYTYLARQE